MLKKTQEKKEKAHHVLGTYFEAVGRRKTAVARVRIYPGRATGADAITVNEKPLSRYFPLSKHRQIAIAPFLAVGKKEVPVTVKVKGGGGSAQAEAIRLGIARALVLEDSSLRSRLKSFGYLTRDSRVVERKKAGKRKARRPQQWRKR